MAEARKRQRAVLATDSDWQTVRERADAAKMDVSRFIVKRLTAPSPVPECPVPELPYRANRAAQPLAPPGSVAGQTFRTRSGGNGEVSCLRRHPLRPKIRLAAK